MKHIYYSIIITLFLALNLNANEYDKWLKAENKKFTSYKNKIQLEYKLYKKAQDDAFKEYKTNIAKNWSNKDVSTKHKWVEYSPAYDEKKIIDYENNTISLEVISSNDKIAKQKILKMYDSLIKYDVKKAYKNDIVEKIISKKLNKKLIVPKTKQKLISDSISKNEIKKIKETIIKIKPKKIFFRDNIIYKVKVKLPNNTLINKAKLYKNLLLVQEKKLDIPIELMYAIIHSESSFNPMAKSYVPAYGLMQIVPRSAGIDSYKYITGKKKLLASSYLYNPSNNIVLGTTYLKILYFRYLKHIKNPQSRLYCTIAAYNTGAGNVARAFIGNTNIYKASSKINKLSSDEVYKRLISNLPHDETKKYLKKVSHRMSIYNKMILANKL